MELRTEMLDENCFAVEADEVLRAIRDRAGGDVTVWYGFGCEHEDESAWSPISVPVTELADFIAASVRKGIFQPGRANLTVDVPSLAIQLTLCHESDIHIKGEAGEFTDYFQSWWTRHGMVVWVRSDDRAAWAKVLPV